MKVLVLGVGMQGRAVLHDLVSRPEVSGIVAADADPAKVASYVSARGWGGRVACEPLDAADPSRLDALMSDGVTIAVDVLPSRFSIPVARAAVRNGVSLVNTCYASAELLGMHDAAAARGVTILPEFGQDPGIDLVMLGESFRTLDSIEEIRSYGGGVPEPEASANPLRWKVTWTFEGVLEAYRRPARVITDGAEVEIPSRDVFAPANTHEVEVSGLGLLEAYPNGNAVQYCRMLGLDTGRLSSAGRYTIRWPGHCAFWKTMVDLHLLDREPVMLDGIPVDRLRYLAAALGPHIQYDPGERDVVMVRVDATGERGGRRRRQRYQLVDRRDLQSGLTAMSRTTGFTASIGALMIGTGLVKGPGILSPLKIGRAHV